MNKKIIVLLLMSTMLFATACSNNINKSNPIQETTITQIIDKNKLYDCRWTYKAEDGSSASFIFNEDGTGEYTSGGKTGSESAYFTGITWTLKDNKLSVTRRGPYTDNYIIYFEGDDLILTNEDNISITYIRMERK